MLIGLVDHLATLLKVAKVLLENGADTEFADGRGATALQAALSMGTKEVVGFIINAGDRSGLGWSYG